MRISFVYVLIIVVIMVCDLCLFFSIRDSRGEWRNDVAVMRQAVKELGLSDLAISTEARYTRHPAVSDPVVPFMDHPGAMEHFPSGSFWRPEQ
jgi:hypothetical protein